MHGLLSRLNHCAISAVVIKEDEAAIFPLDLTFNDDVDVFVPNVQAALECLSQLGPTNHRIEHKSEFQKHFDVLEDTGRIIIRLDLYQACAFKRSACAVNYGEDLLAAAVPVVSPTGLRWLGPKLLHECRHRWQEWYDYRLERPDKERHLGWNHDHACPPVFCKTSPPDRALAPYKGPASDLLISAGGIEAGMCFFVHASHAEQRDSLLQPGVVWVLAGNESAPMYHKQNRTLYVEAKEGRQYLSDKTRAFWTFLAGHQGLFPECKWFFKMDTDTTLNVALLERALSCWDPQEVHYSGIRGLGTNRGVVFAVGACYIVSLGLLQKIGQTGFDTTQLTPLGIQGQAEDIMVAHYFNNSNVTFDNIVRDATVPSTLGRPRFGLYTYRHRDAPYYAENVTCVLFAHRVPPESRARVLGDMQESAAGQISTCNNLVCH